MAGESGADNQVKAAMEAVVEAAEADVEAMRVVKRAEAARTLTLNRYADATERYNAIQTARLRQVEAEVVSCKLTLAMPDPGARA